VKGFFFLSLSHALCIRIERKVQFLLHHRSKTDFPTFDPLESCSLWYYMHCVKNQNLIEALRGFSHTPGAFPLYPSEQKMHHFRKQAVFLIKLT
jgi:hypothetical protein